MSMTVETPTTIRELTRYVEREYPCLRTSYNARREQVVVVGQPGQPEPPAALREILGRSQFELRAQAVADRSRWVGVVNATACESCGETPPYAGHRKLHDVSDGSVDADAVCTNCILEDAEGMFAAARDDDGGRAMNDEPCPACGDGGALVDVGTGIPPRRACTNDDCLVIDYHIGEVQP